MAFNPKKGSIQAFKTTNGELKMHNIPYAAKNGT